MSDGKRLAALLLALCMMGGNILPVYAEEITQKISAVEVMEETPDEGEIFEGDESDGDESDGDESEGDESEEEEPEEPVVKEAWSIVTDKKSYTAAYQGKITIQASCDGKLSYSSDDKSIATVNQSGIVTIKGVGSTTIIITAEEDDTHEQTSVSVKVKGTRAKQSFTVKKKSISVKSEGTGTAFSLGVSLKGGKKLYYESSDEDVVEVSSSGKAKAKNCGTAVITIIAPESDVYQEAVCTVTVKVTRTTPYLSSCSASYKKSSFYKKLMSVKLTGSKSTDVVNVALSQVGYYEGNKSSQLGGTVKGINNYTEYGEWSRLNGAAWCSLYVTWCARAAGVSTDAIPYAYSCSSFYSYYKSQKSLYSWAKVRKKQYTPKKGDMILFSYQKGGSAQHIGYVTGASYTSSTVKITVAEGNMSNQVKKSTYTLKRSSSDGKVNGMYILGVAHPKY